MTNKKTMIFWLITLLCVLSVPCYAKAETVTGSCGATSQYFYDTETKTLTISGTGKVEESPWRENYSTEIEKVVISEGISGWTISNLFKDHTAIVSVSLPDSLTGMGYGAFTNCTSLKSITIPKNVTSDYAILEGAGVTTATIAEGMTELTQLLAKCEALSTVNLPQSLKTIGDFAFKGCKNIQTLTLPSALEKIEGHAFEDCTSLKSITIPKTVVEASCCMQNSSVETVIFEDGMTKIPSSICEENEALKTIQFPQSVKIIGDHAFINCTQLKEVTLPWYLEEIEGWAFAWDNNLEKITIYQNCKKIEKSSFAFSVPNHKFTIYGKKNSFAATYAKQNKYSFKSCKVPALKGITYKKGDLKYTVVTDYTGGKGTVRVAGMTKASSSITIPNTVKLENYNYKVVEIGKKAFYKKSVLKKVTIKATNLSHIGSNAFSKIDKKAVVTVPKKKYKVYSTMLKKAGVKSPMTIKKK